MNNTETDNLNVKKLLQETAGGSLLDTPRHGTCNKPGRPLAQPHLEPRTVNGKTYWYYRRGIDPPIYLGTADTILKKVKGNGKNGY